MQRKSRGSQIDLIRRYKKYLRRLRKVSESSDMRTVRSSFLEGRIARIGKSLNPLGNSRRAAALTALSVGILGLGVGEAQAQIPSITSFQPATNATQVSLNSNININFSTTMNASNLSTGNIRIFGSQTGFLSTTGVLSGNPNLQFNPTNKFKPGELITVTVTGATSDSGDLPLPEPLVFQFTADVPNGDGTFSASTFGSGNTTRLAIGDLDGDGDLDAILANYGQPQDIWLNDGSGSFTTSTFGSGNSQDVALGDLDGDGDLDAIIGNYNQPQDIWLNDGSGNFSASTFGSGSTLDVNLADLDGDGNLDVILSSNSGSANEIWLGNGDGTFTSASFGTGNSRQSAIGDIDGDGDLDVLIVNQNQSTDVWWGNGDGTFFATNFGDANNSRAMAMGDLDGDGDLDVLIANYGANEIWLGNGNATFSSSTFGGGQTTDVAIGDLDGDGDLDAAFARAGSENNDIWLNNGDGTFSSSSQGAGNSLGIAFGDLDGDKDLDALIGNLGQTNDIWINNGEPPILPVISSLTPSCVLAGNEEQILTVCGADLNITEATISVLPSGGSPVVVSTAQISTTKITVTIPAGLTATAGNLILTLSTSAGQTSSNLLVGAGVTINSTNNSCSNETFDYYAGPNTSGATHSWSVSGGVIVSGQGTPSVIVDWSQLGGTLNVTRSYISGCETTASVSVGAISLIEAVADATSSVLGAVTTNVLNNDVGAGLEIIALDNPPNGSATHTNGNVTFTPNTSFEGTETFNYTVRNADGCEATTSISVTIENALCPIINIGYVERQKDRSGSVRGLRGIESAVVSRDGRYVYTAGRKDHSIAIFARDLSDGSLTYINRIRNLRGGVSGIKFVSDLAIHPNGTRLYAVGAGDNALAVFDRNTTTGSLTFLERKRRGENDGGLIVSGVKQARRLTISEDGKNIYVSGYGENSLASFDYNSTNASIHFAESFKDGSGGVDGLRGIMGVAVSPDGKHVYAAGSKKSALALFARNTVSGDLTFTTRYRNNVNGISGLGLATDVTLSPDGKHVYVAGKGDNAIAMFNRNAGNGSLTFVARYRNGVNGISGIKRVCALEISPDGCHLWAAGNTDNAVAIFERNPVNGTLTFLEKVVDGNDGVDGLRGVVALAQDNTGTSIYASGSKDNAVAVLMRNRPPVANPDGPIIAELEDFTTIDPLLNDGDPNGHSLTITSTTDGAIGTVSITGGGSTVRYESDGDEGPDTFTYTIDDGFGGTSTATVTVFVEEGLRRKEGAVVNKQADTPLGLRINPNPVSVNATIGFGLTVPANVTMRIIDARGMLVLRQHLGKLHMGQHSPQLDIMSERGDRLTAGMYYLELVALDDNGMERKQMLPFVVQ